jgi:hypothetical protein
VTITACLFCLQRSRYEKKIRRLRMTSAKAKAESQLTVMTLSEENSRLMEENANLLGNNRLSNVDTHHKCITDYWLNGFPCIWSNSWNRCNSYSTGKRNFNISIVYIYRTSIEPLSNFYLTSILLLTHI